MKLMGGMLRLGRSVAGCDGLAYLDVEYRLSVLSVSMVTPPWNREIALSAEIRFGSSARAARSPPDSGRIRTASDDEFDM